MTTDSKYGPKVQDGRVLYHSASSLQTGDTSQQGGCLTKAWITYVLGIREEDKPHHVIGKETHKSIETYLLTGEMTLNRLALAAKHYMPSPRKPGLLVEAEIDGQLQINSTRVEGMVDLVDPNCDYIDENGVERRDPKGTVQITDWKTSSNIKRYGKSGLALRQTIQMPLYADWAFSHFGDGAKQVRISHVYMQTKNKLYAHKSTILVDREDLVPHRVHVSKLDRVFQDLAKETDINKVPRNIGACEAFGGCSLREYCPRSTQQTLIPLLQKARDRQPKKDKNMSIFDNPLDNINDDGSTSAGPVILDKFDLVVEVIEKLGRGFPALDTAATEQYYAVKGQQYTPGDTFKGTGDLAVRSMGLDALYKNASQKDARIPALVPAGVQLDLPSMIPDNVPDVTAVVVPPPAEVVTPKGITEEATAAKQESEETTRKKRGTASKYSKMKKPELVAICEEHADLIENGTVPAPVSESAPMETLHINCVPITVKTLYINCIPMDVQYTDLSGYIRTQCQRIEDQTGGVDIRCSSHDACKFAAWKGTLAMAVRETLPEGTSFVIHTRDSDIARVVAETLAEIMPVVVRGV